MAVCLALILLLLPFALYGMFLLAVFYSFTLDDDI